MSKEHLENALLATAVNQVAPPPDAGFINEREVLNRVPVSRRTWQTWKAKKIVPFIRIGRRCLYDFSLVRQALLRHNRGGE